MKIKRIILHNIQKHEHLDLTFDKNLTAITGESDQGKSSILRALGWVLFNKPSSNELRRKINDVCTDESYVILYITKNDEEHVIERYVSNKLNLYKLDGNEFRSFKRDVPKPISDLLNLDYRINFQKQFDSPFLLGDTSGEIAKLFNELLGLEEANDILDLINKDITNDTKQKESIERELEQYQNILEVLEEFSKFDEMGDKIESDYTLIEGLEHELSNLRILAERISRTDQEISKNKGICFSGDCLERLLKDYCEKENNYKKTKKLIDEISKTPSVDISFSIDNLTTDYDYWKKMEILMNSLEDIRYNISRCDMMLMSYEKQLNEKNEELSSIKVCPTCKRPME